MPSGIEVFGNQPFTSITSGGTTTSDTSWTASALGNFSAAQSTATPNTYFYVQDPNVPQEIMCVTSTGTGTNWTVVRGAQGSTASVHQSPFTVYQLISASTLQSFKQTPGTPAAATTVTSTTETVLATYTVPSPDLVNGAMWEIMAWGPMSGNGATHPVFQFALYWGGSGSVGGAFTLGTGKQIAFLKSGVNTVANTTTLNAGGSFDLLGNVTLLTSTTVTAQMNIWWNNATSITTAVVTGQTTNTQSGGASSGTAQTITAGSGPIILTGFWPTAGSTQTFTATAPVIYRGA